MFISQPGGRRGFTSIRQYSKVFESMGFGVTDSALGTTALTSHYNVTLGRSVT